MRMPELISASVRCWCSETPGRFRPRHPTDPVLNTAAARDAKRGKATAAGDPQAGTLTGEPAVQPAEPSCRTDERQYLHPVLHHRQPPLGTHGRLFNDARAAVALQLQMQAEGLVHLRHDCSLQ